MKKESVKKRIINIDDRKILLSFVAIFLVGTLFSSFTGNAGRVTITTELDENEFRIVEGGSQMYGSNLIKLSSITEEGSIIVNVVTNQKSESRVIKNGQEIYINGVFVTNINSNSESGIAMLRVK